MGSHSNSSSTAGNAINGAAKDATAQAKETLHRAQDVVHETAELVQHVRRVKGSWQEQAAAIAGERPYIALAAAAGAGFVLGGGVSSLMSRRLWRWGGRLALSLAMQQLTSGSLIGNIKESIES